LLFLWHSGFLLSFPKVKINHLLSQPQSNSRPHCFFSYLLKLIYPSDVLDVGTTYTITWNALPHKYPFVTIVLWDASPDGLFAPLAPLNNFTNNGSASWTVDPASFVGQHRLGLGVGLSHGLKRRLMEIGPGDAMVNTTTSGVFSIALSANPPTTTETNPGNSGSSNPTTSISTSSRGSSSRTRTSSDGALPQSSSAFSATGIS